MMTDDTVPDDCTGTWTAHTSLVGKTVAKMALGQFDWQVAQVLHSGNVSQLSIEVSDQGGGPFFVWGWGDGPDGTQSDPVRHFDAGLTS